MSVSQQLLRAADVLRADVNRLKFAAPITHVYNPLEYAWDAHAAYLTTHGNSRKQVIFLGMNPGPFGMVQTGVPFGEVSSVRDWLRISAVVGKPKVEHPKRPIDGFACKRSEVSGQRLWGLFAARFGTAPKFFARHFVVNYCPLAFLESSGRNFTPDKLPAHESAPLSEACDQHLRAVVKALEPEWLIAVGDFAAKRLELVFAGENVKLGKVLHPSPASPAANRGWAQQATRQLEELAVW